MFDPAAPPFLRSTGSDCRPGILILFFVIPENLFEFKDKQRKGRKCSQNIGNGLCQKYRKYFVRDKERQYVNKWYQQNNLTKQG